MKKKGKNGEDKKDGIEGRKKVAKRKKKKEREKGGGGGK